MDGEELEKLECNYMKVKMPLVITPPDGKLTAADRGYVEIVFSFEDIDDLKNKSSEYRQLLQREKELYEGG